MPSYLAVLGNSVSQGYRASRKATTISEHNSHTLLPFFAQIVNNGNEAKGVCLHEHRLIMSTKRKPFGFMNIVVFAFFPTLTFHDRSVSSHNARC